MQALVRWLRIYVSFFPNRTASAITGQKRKPSHKKLVAEFKKQLAEATSGAEVLGTTSGDGSGAKRTFEY